MAIRAKFRLNSFTTEMQGNARRDEKGEHIKVDGKYVYDQVEKRTLNFTPVYSNEPGSENKAFWDATPSGSVQLGVVNQEAWKHFELGKKYYLAFTPAE